GQESACPALVQTVVRSTLSLRYYGGSPTDTPPYQSLPIRWILAGVSTQTLSRTLENSQNYSGQFYDMLPGVFLLRPTPHASEIFYRSTCLASTPIER